MLCGLRSLWFQCREKHVQFPVNPTKSINNQSRWLCPSEYFSYLPYGHPFGGRFGCSFPARQANIRTRGIRERRVSLYCRFWLARWRLVARSRSSSLIGVSRYGSRTWFCYLYLFDMSDPSVHCSSDCVRSTDTMLTRCDRQEKVFFSALVTSLSLLYSLCIRYLCVRNLLIINLCGYSFRYYVIMRFVEILRYVTNHGWQGLSLTKRFHIDFISNASSGNVICFDEFSYWR